MKEIIKAIKSEEFATDISDYLFYGANIKLEKFIAFSLCKVLAKSGCHAVLEKKRVDLVLDAHKVEVKFHYDFDVLSKLPKEIKNLQVSLVDYYNQLCASQGSKSWMISFGVLQDIIFKGCDIFIWVISERNYSSYRDVLNLDNVCFVADMKKLHYSSGEKNIDQAIEEFSISLSACRVHKLYKEKIIFTEPLVSNVYFFLFDFRGY